MEIVPASGDASADVLAVVLEIHGEEFDVRLRSPDLADAADHVFALLYGRHQLRSGVVADRHQVEVEAEARTLLLQQVEERVGRNRLHIRPRVADGRAEYDAVVTQDIHGAHGCSVMALAAPCVVRLLGSFDGQHERDVAELPYLLRHLIVDERGVGIQREEAVIVLLGKLEDFLHFHGRLAAGHHVEIGAELLALGHDLVHVLEAHGRLVAIGSGPAAHAVQVAGHRGIEQDEPRNVAVVFLTVGADHLRAAEERLIAEVQQHGLRVVRIGLVHDAVDEAHPPVIGILDIFADLRDRFLIGAAPPEFLSQIHDLDIGLRPVILTL